MKITKSYIKQIIVEELQKLQEGSNYSPEEQARRRKSAAQEFNTADPIEQDDLADLADQVVGSNNLNDLKIKLASVPKARLDKLKGSNRLKDKINRANLP